MNGNRLVLDTSPIIFVLGGTSLIAEHIDQKECWISVVSELELFGKKYF